MSWLHVQILLFHIGIKITILWINVYRILIMVINFLRHLVYLSTFKKRQYVHPMVQTSRHFDSQTEPQPTLFLKDEFFLLDFWSHTKIYKAKNRLRAEGTDNSIPTLLLQRYITLQSEL